jgi:hypothetical protein
VLVDRCRHIGHRFRFGAKSLAIVVFPSCYPAHVRPYNPRLRVDFRLSSLDALTQFPLAGYAFLRSFHSPRKQPKQSQDHGVGGDSDCDCRLVRPPCFGASGKLAAGKTARNALTAVCLSQPSEAGADQSTATATTIVQAIADVG